MRLLGLVLVIISIAALAVMMFGCATMPDDFMQRAIAPHLPPEVRPWLPIIDNIINEVQQSQLDTQEELEQEWRDEGREIPSEPFISLQHLTVMPEIVQPGGKLTISGEYVAMGSDVPPTGSYRLYKNGDLAFDRDVNFADVLKYTGRSEFVIPIEVPEAAASGVYEIEVELVYDNVRITRKIHFNVK